jgi:hypothetical protein
MKALKLSSKARRRASLNDTRAKPSHIKPMELFN